MKPPLFQGMWIFFVLMSFQHLVIMEESIYIAGASGETYLITVERLWSSSKL